MSDIETIQTATQAGYIFTPTQDWFSFNVDAWRLLFPLVKSPNPRVLEIGSWEGRSAVFLLTELCAAGGEIVCIDHFDLMQTPAGRDRHAKITHNLSLTGKHFRIIDEFSFPALMMMLKEEMGNTSPGYDWIYVDGSHEADDTFLDGELVWRLAKKGAIIIFDDYRWDKEPDDSIHHPKRGIDAFMTLHAGEFELLSSPTQYQVVIKKTSEMRIGFLVKDVGNRNLEGALGYGVNIAIAADAAYAMAAAVAVNSAITHTRGRITVYIVDVGLNDENREKIHQSIPLNADATLLFVHLPIEGMVAKRGATWAKIDMVSVLPVERVLYLDADVLVRADLRDLWDTDLEGKSIGAARDVGFPMGHDETKKRPYFNAGVLLMDLAKVRGKLDGLKAGADEMENSKFQDQDVLNAQFDGDWLPLSLKWNAQGLGTYANLPSSDRSAIDLSVLTNPSVVHFTGPVNPKLEKVMNPYVQPYTAKPWGYAGAPGHPYREQWWDTVNRTAWKGWRTSDQYQELCIIGKEAAMHTACDRFVQKVGEGLEIRS